MLFDHCCQNIKRIRIKIGCCILYQKKGLTIIDTNFSYFSIEVKLEEIGCLKENWPLSLQFFRESSSGRYGGQNVVWVNYKMSHRQT